MAKDHQVSNMVLVRMQCCAFLKCSCPRRVSLADCLADLLERAIALCHSCHALQSLSDLQYTEVGMCV